MSIGTIVAKVQGDIDKTIRKTTISVFASVIKMTPVDTGRARGNWQCSVGSPKTDALITTDSSGANTASSMVATVPEKAGSVVWLANNVPYITRLEYGYSKQAPAGMVRVSLSRFGAIMRQS